MEIESSKGVVKINFYHGTKSILKATQRKEGWMILVKGGDDLLVLSNDEDQKKHIVISRYHLNVAKRGVHKRFKPGEIFITDNRTKDHYAGTEEKVDFLVKDGYFGVASKKMGHWTTKLNKAKLRYSQIKRAIDEYVSKGDPKIKTIILKDIPKEELKTTELNLNTIKLEIVGIIKKSDTPGEKLDKNQAPATEVKNP